MASATFRPRKTWKRLGPAFLVSAFFLVAATVCAAWLSTIYSSHAVREQSLKSVRNQVRLGIETLANSVHTALLRGTDAGPREVQAAEDTLAHQLDAAKTAVSAFPDVVSALNNLQEFLRGPAKAQHKLLLETAAEGGTNAVIPLLSQHRLLHPDWDRLFSDLSTEIDHAVHQENNAATQSFITAILLVPALLLAGLAINLFGMASDEQPLAAIQAAIQKIRDGDFSHRLGWEGNDELSQVARQVDGLCGDLGTSLPRLRASGQATTTASSLLASHSKQQHALLASLSAQVMQFGVLSDNLRSGAENISKQTEETRRAVETIAAAPERVRNLMGTSREKSEGAAELTNAASEKVGILMRSTDETLPVLAAISKIADQASLLSLNAAIEAEKAGEYGLGFAVVAMEIRRFAEQTLGSATELEKAIVDIRSTLAAVAEDIRNSSARMVELAKQSTETLGETQQLGRHLDALGGITVAVQTSAQQQLAAVRALADAISGLSRGLQDSSMNGQLDLAVKQLETSAEALNSTLAAWPRKT